MSGYPTSRRTIDTLGSLFYPLAYVVVSTPLLMTSNRLALAAVLLADCVDRLDLN